MFWTNKIYRKKKIGTYKVYTILGFNFCKKIKKKYDENFCRNLKPQDYEKVLSQHYEKRMGHPLDLSNPQTLTEKMQWIKLYDLRPEKTLLADKYLVRDWVKEKIGEQYLIPLLGSWDSFDEIDFSKLPERFVLKCNHGSGMNLVVRDKSKLDIKDAKLHFDIWMKTNFAYVNLLELQYKDIKPKIIAEQYMEDAQGHFYDFKFHCYNGKPQFVAMTSDLTSENKADACMAYYDMDWNKQEFHDTYRRDERDVQPPLNFDEMKKIAGILAKDFLTVRVDLYNLDGKIYFGEMTFTDSAGYTKFEPAEYDLVLGKMLTLPQKAAS